MSSEKLIIDMEAGDKLRFEVIILPEPKKIGRHDILTRVAIYEEESKEVKDVIYYPVALDGDQIREQAERIIEIEDKIIQRKSHGKKETIETF